jgi:pimeloyl-ACP methyl ester carboxylesterase/DNA-binding winged helix-turn-helix (wHTH) protein
VPAPDVYAFDDVEIDLGRFEVRRAGAAVHVEPQVFDVLAYLVRHRERVVPKAELLDNVWGDRFVGDSALTSRLKAARRAIGDDGESQRVIRTVRGRGYRFVADVRTGPATGPGPGVTSDPVTGGAGGAPTRAAEATAAAAAAEATPASGGPAGGPARPAAPVNGGPGTRPLDQAIRFCTAGDGTRIAYATIGTGPPLVKAANWMTHLDFDWESPAWHHWLEGLARGRTLVRYDERGCGLSDWDVEAFGIEAWVDDLALVVDAMGLERFPLLGVSQGAAVAVEYAVRHPERVTRLVLAGAYPRGRLVRATTDEEHRAAALDVELARVGWGRSDQPFSHVFAYQFLPDGTREQWDAFTELQRRTTSADNAVRFLEAFARIDVTAAAQQVRCPTLLLHARHELRVPFSAARELATLIPGSRLVPLDSRNHILTNFEPAWPVFLREVDRFLAAG